MSQSNLISEQIERHQSEIKRLESEIEIRVGRGEQRIARLLKDHYSNLASLQKQLERHQLERDKLAQLLVVTNGQPSQLQPQENVSLG